jgi:hypothetical protein
MILLSVKPFLMNFIEWNRFGTRLFLPKVDLSKMRAEKASYNHFFCRWLPSCPMLPEVTFFGFFVIEAGSVAGLKSSNE